MRGTVWVCGNSIVDGNLVSLDSGERDGRVHGVVGDGGGSITEGHSVSLDSGGHDNSV